MLSKSPFCLLFLTFISTCCEITLEGSQIRHPKQFSFLFSSSSETKGSLCFSLLKPLEEEKVYMVRLDYLPYTCLEASNDVKLDWDGEKYTVKVQVSRKCKRNGLRDNEDESYRMIYEFREGYHKGGILVESELVDRYLPALALMFIASMFIQKGVFEVTLTDKIKGR